MSDFHNQFIGNHARAEDVLYASELAPTVVVGTSLAARLDENALGDEIDVLAFAGGSALTGLELLLGRETLPERVVVEANLLEKSADEEMLARLYNPPVRFLKRYLRSMRYRYQPQNVLLSRVVRAAGGGGASGRTLASEARSSEIERRVEAERVAADLEDHPVWKELERVVATLEARGTEVLLVTMPVAAELEGTARGLARRAALDARFGAVPLLEDESARHRPYRTTDGVHLAGEEARRFSRFLRNALCCADEPVPEAGVNPTHRSADRGRA